MYVVGIDENGLGPVLGPLVVTGSLFRCSEKSRFGPTGTDFSPLCIRDSKKVFSQRNKSRGERAVLTMAALVNGNPAATCTEFLDRFATGRNETHTVCPGEGEKMCRSGGSPLPIWDRFPSPETASHHASRLKETLARRGLGLVDVKAEVCCVRDFNALLTKCGGSKAGVNFALFERVIRYFHERYGPEVLFLCGKNMATMRYEPFFGYLRQFPVVSKEESPEVSVYRLDGLGEVQFLMDGEEASLPIAVSSLFGKYIREVFMERQNAFFARALPGLPHVSGYRDRITKKVIQRIGDPEKTLMVPRVCFLREK